MPELLQHQKALALILKETKAQDEKWGPQREHHPLLWLAILMEEVGEAAEAVLEMDGHLTGLDELREEVVQAAAVAVQWITAMDGE